MSFQRACHTLKVFSYNFMVRGHCQRPTAFSFGLVLALVLSGCAGKSYVQSDIPTLPPAILLTGWDPYFEWTDNASWEAIAPLEGQTWRGYRLYTRKLPVKWGAVRPLLEQWISELKPVAVFSFGQGYPSRFDLEVVVANARYDHPDNFGQKPLPLVNVVGGPEWHRTSADIPGLVTALLSKGYPARVSRNAEQGRGHIYMCNECAYHLEDLKMKHYSEMHVLFCHVPGLRTRALPSNIPVTSSYLTQFVLDLLEIWETHRTTR